MQAKWSVVTGGYTFFLRNIHIYRKLKFDFLTNIYLTFTNDHEKYEGYA